MTYRYDFDLVLHIRCLNYFNTCWDYDGDGGDGDDDCDEYDYLCVLLLKVV